MVSIALLLLIIALALLVIRAATVALTLTGISEDIARFQVRSALTGVGYSTDESNIVLRYPIRRRIISFLMVIGSAGIISAMATLVVSFARTEPVSRWLQFGLLIAGIAALALLARSRWLERYFNGVVEKFLVRRTNFHPQQILRLVELPENYEIAELRPEPDSELVGRTLQKLDIERGEFRVLGIERDDGSFIGIPKAKSPILSGDRLLVYGQRNILDGLVDRFRSPLQDGTDLQG